MTTAAELLAASRYGRGAPKRVRRRASTIPKAPSNLEASFDQAWRLLRPAGLPSPVAEHVFHPTRRWRVDRAFVAERVAVELEGGLYAKRRDGKPSGRHTSITGFIEDCQKYNAAALAGWLVLRFTERDLTRSPQAVVDQVAAALRLRGAP